MVGMRSCASGAECLDALLRHRLPRNPSFWPLIFPWTCSAGRAGAHPGAHPYHLTAPSKTSHQPLSPRQNLQEVAFEILGLGNMGKNGVVERLRQILQDSDVTFRVHACINDHL